MVTETLPTDGALDVPTNTRVAVIFDTPMRPIDASHFTLSNGQYPVAGTITRSTDGRTSTFAPLLDLAPHTRFEGAILPFAVSTSGVALGTEHRWSFTTGNTTEHVPPTVAWHTPGFSAVGVPLDQSISITFSEPMDPSSITAATLTLRQGSTLIVTTVSSTGLSARLTPWEPLEPGTEYTVSLSAEVADLAGNPLESAYEWRFTTGEPLDSTPPTVISTSPSSGMKGVALDAPIWVRFSEPMAPISLSAATFTLRQGVTLMTATPTYAGLTASLAPWEALAYDTEYTVTLSVDVVDLAGNPLESAYEWRFTTISEPDTIAPQVESTLPADLAESIALDVSLSATFSEALAAATVNSATMTLMRGSTPVAGTVSSSGQTATFVPVAALEYDTEYTATLSAGILDLAGNPLSEAYVWRFTTRTAPDTSSPTVISTSPSSGELGAATGLGVRVTFSEPMDVASVTSSTFSVSDASSTPVAGSVTLDVSGMIATFMPSAELTRGTDYEVMLSVGLADLAGNPLKASLSWSFTTAAGPSPASLGTAAQFVILARTGITTTGVSEVIGDLGLSPGVDAVLLGWGQSAATTFSTSPMVDGHIFLSTYAAPTPDVLILASSDMQAAYDAVAAQGPPDELGLNAGALGGVTFAPGIYRWDAAATIASDMTIEGGPNDVWVFQINGALAMAASVSVVLSGGARASNVFWQVNGAINIGATSHFEGIAMASTAINVGAGSSVNGRLLAQTAVSVDTCDIALASP